MTAGKPRVAVVTGASAGVGRATVRKLAREGVAIGLIARGIDGLEGARADVERLGARALVLPLDVSDADAVEAAAGRVEAELGPIDLWINNAMLSVFSPVRKMTPEEFRRVTEVTYLGYVYGTLAALKRMLPRDQGVILQVGSALAYRGIPLQAAYCGAKHAIQGFSESLRSELLHDKSGVQLRMVELPAVNTPQFGWVKSNLPRAAQPVPPIFQPEVVADGIWWMVLHDRPELYIGWPTVKTIAGDRIFGRLLDRYAARAGWDSQMTDEPRDPDQPHNLWQPIPGDYGAHGAFDDRATSRSVQLWASMHKRALLLAAGAAGLATLFLTIL
ncbi:MAG TPA: SDR family oxidoreductase [Longimicrobiales bacterium]|nr:SDR family oxidoreductase [Longimicrobiales bacterium]